MFQTRFRNLIPLVLAAAVALVVAVGAGTSAADGPVTVMSTPFQGVKANTGTVSFHREGKVVTLVLSDDFVVPDTPDPHWQVVDSQGVVYLLQRLPIKGDKVNRTVTLPAYVKDVAKVQIWCAFAETLLGEAAFQKPAM